MENLEYEVEKHKIRIENLTILPNGEVFADFYIGRIEPGIKSFDLENFQIEYSSFEIFFNKINEELYKKHNIIYIKDVAEKYFRKAYEHCHKQIVGELKI